MSDRLQCENGDRSDSQTLSMKGQMSASGSRPPARKPKKSAVTDLAYFAADRLRAEIAEGIKYIDANVRDLNEAAFQLHQAKQYRTSGIMRGIAEEEAAKVLILIDAIRCPANKRQSTLKRFGDHLAKRIYAVASSYARIWTFGELREFVDRCRQPYSLDGPNSVDWLIRNEIVAERERAMYVDFTQDVTDANGGYFWIAPIEPDLHLPSYKVPDVITLSRALSNAGARTPDGLAVIGDIWRGFTPSTNTDREQLMKLIERTLDRLIQSGLASGEETSMEFIVSQWSFPLWPLELRANPQDFPAISDLHKFRTRRIQDLEAKAAKRDPPPPITRDTVKTMHEAYTAWKRAADEHDRREFPHRHGPGFHIRPSDEYEGQYRLPSYVQLTAKFRKLNSNERIALLALAWFARDREPDWSHVFQHATNMSGNVGEDYQIALGEHWLAGHDRWQAPPRPFQAGTRF